MVREIIKWCDNKLDEAKVESNEKKALAKAVKSGAVEGLIEGCVIVGFACFTTGIVMIVKDAFKK